MDRRALVRQYLELAGAREFRPSHEGWVCRCPFHDGPTGYHTSKSASFSINATTGRFVCFSGVCSRQGSILSILVDLCGYQYSKAKELLGDFHQPEIPDSESIVIPPYEKRHLIGRMADTRAQDQEDMPTLDPSILGAYDVCPQYMLDRGFTKKVLRSWDIGFTPSCTYDRYAGSPVTGRVTIPVWTKRGKLAGITLRGVVPEQSPKYLHQRFDKRLLLYGENRLDDVSETQPVVLVEAQPSVLWFSQVRIPNAVSTMGSKVSPVQLKRLARYPYVILAFDDDEAGYEATWRVLYGHETIGPRREKIWSNGLLQLLGRGRVWVAAGYGNYANKDNSAKTAKDPQEIEESKVKQFYADRTPGEEWYPPK